MAIQKHFDVGETMNQAAKIALIKGDGIGVDVADATVKTLSQALHNVDLPQPDGPINAITSFS